MSDAPRVFRAQYQTTVNGQLRAFQFPFETHHDDVDAVVADLAASGILPVTKLHVVDDGRGGLMIRRRERVGLAIAGLMLIDGNARPVWEPEE